jgi:2-C-methyl-D-erythritol 4-phosphate cytidylyltransferase
MNINQKEINFNFHFCNKMNNQYAIIVAGGSGSRMGTTTKKQFILLDGKPIIIHALEKFLSYNEALQIVVVLPESHIDNWKRIAAKYPFAKQFKITEGRATRFQSVKNGLELLPKEGFVAIHDAVRPMLSVALIERCFNDAMQFGSGVAAISCVDTVRQKKESGFEILDGDKLWMMQTPQCFDLKKLKVAFQLADEKKTFTDDAEVFSHCNFPLHITEGEKNNIKITYPQDLQFAEWLLSKK